MMYRRGLTPGEQDFFRVLESLDSDRVETSEVVDEKATVQSLNAWSRAVSTERAIRVGKNDAAV